MLGESSGLVRCAPITLPRRRSNVSGSATSRERRLMRAVRTQAVQFARRKVAHVIATASSGERILRDIGAEHVIDARVPDAAEKRKSFAPTGLNAILVLARGAVLEKCTGQLVDGGRLAYPNGVSPGPRKRAKVRRI